MENSSELLKLLLSRLDQQEQMLTTLIKMQAAVNGNVEELKQDVGELRQNVDGLKQEANATKDLLHTFRSETNVNFAKFDRRIKLIEADLDATMVHVEQLQSPQN